jgi:hypothetical protein
MNLVVMNMALLVVEDELQMVSLHLVIMIGVKNPIWNGEEVRECLITNTRPTFPVGKTTSTKDGQSMKTAPKEVLETLLKEEVNPALDKVAIKENLEDLLIQENNLVKVEAPPVISMTRSLDEDSVYKMGA